MPMLTPIILAGGSGTRFWPLSRRQRPKQLLSVLGDQRSLIETTVERLLPLSDNSRPVRIVCRSSLVPPTRALLDDGWPIEFIEEPAARDTAPAIILACAHAEAHHGDLPIAFFPADHFIAGQQAFQDCLKAAAHRAQQGSIVTLGVPPTHPETGYGYIETSEPIDAQPSEPTPLPVASFVEKPDHGRALNYLHSGRHLWNCGIFILTPSALWRELQRQHPKHWSTVEQLRVALQQSPPDAPAITSTFQQLPCLSIDYAIMEQATSVDVIPANFRWSDVGHWDALDEVLPTDTDGNVVDAHDTLLDDVSRSVIISRGDHQRLIAASGLSNLVIVDTDDALLITPRDRAQKVRELVAQLRAADRKNLI